MCAQGKRKSAYGFNWKYDEVTLRSDNNSNEKKNDNEKWMLIKKINVSKYYISNYGRVKNNIGEKNRYLKMLNNGDGYEYIMIKGKIKFIHRLVAKKFIENPNNYEIVNHKNGIKNDNVYTNLEWVTTKMNNKHAIESGLRKKVRQIIQYDDNNNIIEVFKTSIMASIKLNMTNGNILRYCKGLTVSPLFKLKFLSPTDDLINNKIDPLTIPKNKKDLRIKQIIHYDKDYNIINIFTSTKEASQKLNISISSIKRYCKNSRNGNMKLKYLSPTDDLINKKIDISTIPKSYQKTKVIKKMKISIYNKKDGKLIETLDDPIQISKKYGLSYRFIKKHCDGLIKYSKSKYIFKYA